jgi:hypothetical protein
MTMPEAADRGVAALLRVIALYPVSALNLAVVLLGGGWLYFTETAAITTLRADLERAETEVTALDQANRHAAELAETRYEGLRNDLAGLRGSILAIQTDVSWLARGSRAEPAAPR